jgi:hypothetical protein
MDEVFRTPMISAEVKVFLLFLACRHMSLDGRVSESRARLAEGLGCYERRINERFDAAIRGGLMERVSRGQKHRTAVYCAVIPGVKSDSQGAGNPPAERSQGAGHQPAEADSQGAKNAPAENAQGAGNPPAETVSGGGQPAPHIYTHLPVSDLRDGGVVVSLFDEKTTTSLRSKKTPARKRASELSAPDAFDEFWTAYPRRVGKGAARKAWDKAIKANANPIAIVAAAKHFATDPRRAEADIKYTPHPATWLNAERWADEPEPEHRAAPAAYRSTTDERVAQAQALKARFGGQPPVIRGEITR